MGSWSYEGIVLPESGYEEDFLHIGDPPGQDYIGAVGMIEKAAGTEVPGGVNSSFEYEHNDEDGFWTSGRDEYRNESGRQYPPVYRVRIQVEAEQCSDEETAEYWAQYQRRYDRSEAAS